MIAQSYLALSSHLLEQLSIFSSSLGAEGAALAPLGAYIIPGWGEKCVFEEHKVISASCTAFDWRGPVLFREALTRQRAWLFREAKKIPSFCAL